MLNVFAFPFFHVCSVGWLAFLFLFPSFRNIIAIATIRLLNMMAICAMVE